MIRAAACALLFACASAGALAAQSEALPPIPVTDASADAPHWFDTVAGKKLTSVDGSTITVSPAEGGLAVEIVPATGATRDLLFTFVGDGIGTISDGGPKAAGVFRQNPSGLEAEFSDGHTEFFAANPEGGISMVLSASSANSYCMRWYPEGHLFDASDRKAALAAYASKLGLADPAVQKSSSGCSDAAPAAAKLHHSKSQKRDASSGAGAFQASVSAEPILVRTSEVHLIDADPAPAATQMQPITQPAQPIVQAQPQVAFPSHPQQQLASAAPDKPTPLQTRGASSCLSVDTDGANWGFRNGCGYSVQFAYCLKNGSDKTVACGSGSGSGNVAANGFASVLSSDAIVTADQEFRWIACVGGAGQVAAHLDRPDPPAGRCVVQGSPS